MPQFIIPNSMYCEDRRLKILRKEIPLDLTILGWSRHWDENFRSYAGQGYRPARVALQHKNSYCLYSEYGELTGKITGKMLYQATTSAQLPVVGDWVAIQVDEHRRQGIIQAVLPRRSKFSRQRAGTRTEEQVIAANVETMFLVSGLDQDLNLRRLERYLLLVWESGSNPLIVLNKVDLCPDLAGKLSQVESVAFGVPIVTISAVYHQGLAELQPFLQAGHTLALLGSSGVGKSTLVNCLLGQQRQKTQEVRHGDDHGRHTTTCRELILLPQGGMIIDTPGMRELQVWGDDTALHSTFDDVEALARQCRFRDCRHDNEPGCAVQQAITAGALAPKRLVNYRKLQRELYFHERKVNQQEHLAEKKTLEEY